MAGDGAGGRMKTNIIVIPLFVMLVVAGIVIAFPVTVNVLLAIIQWVADGIVSAGDWIWGLLPW